MSVSCCWVEEDNHVQFVLFTNLNLGNFGENMSDVKEVNNSFVTM